MALNYELQSNSSFHLYNHFLIAKLIVHCSLSHPERNRSLATLVWFTSWKISALNNLNLTDTPTWIETSLIGRSNTIHIFPNGARINPEFPFKRQVAPGLFVPCPIMGGKTAIVAGPRRFLRGVAASPARHCRRRVVTGQAVHICWLRI